MEESLIKEVLSHFDVEELSDLRTVNPLTLAYIGDCFYDFVIRSVVVSKYHTKPMYLHRKTAKYAKAEAQAAIVELLADSLTEEETAVYKRGRNAKSPTSAKNASITDYRKATGLEALIGYLYLKGEEKRAIELIKTGVSLYTPNESDAAEPKNTYRKGNANE
ncbi:MAG: ribonuclease III [Lachnospiraceae bacterium]|nr:ribonuclease III [Lachnospiraceae bacterium]